MDVTCGSGPHNSRATDMTFCRPARHPHQRQLLGRHAAHRHAVGVRVLGVLLCERAGVLNLGIEGIMVAGAFAGWVAVHAGAGLWGGVASPRWWEPVLFPCTVFSPFHLHYRSTWRDSA